MTTVDLETRIHNRKDELTSKLADLRANTQIDAVVAGDKIKARLSELDHIVKAGVVDGWANVGEGARVKLETWLSKP